MTAFSDGFVLAQRRTKSADSYTAPSSPCLSSGSRDARERKGTNPTRRERDGERGQGLSNIGESSSLSHVSPLAQESASSACCPNSATACSCQGNAGAWLLLVYKMSWSKPFPSLGFDQDQRRDRC